MNIADAPNEVSLGGDWLGDKIGRVPIIVTGNDFSKMFAPLIRDGRMAKFYWEPTQEDLENILWQMYRVRPHSLTCGPMWMSWWWWGEGGGGSGRSKG
jgi:hypothetical protein